MEDTGLEARTPKLESLSILFKQISNPLAFCSLIYEKGKLHLGHSS